MSSEPLERGPVKHNYQLRAPIKEIVEQTVKKNPVPENNQFFGEK